MPAGEERATPAALQRHRVRRRHHRAQQAPGRELQGGPHRGAGEFLLSLILSLFSIFSLSNSHSLSLSPLLFLFLHLLSLIYLSISSSFSPSPSPQVEEFAYKATNWTDSRAGDLLYMFLGPACTALAFRIYAQSRQMQDRLPAIIGTSAALAGACNMGGGLTPAEDAGGVLKHAVPSRVSFSSNLPLPPSSSTAQEPPSSSPP
jgi:hypothetical protein